MLGAPENMVFAAALALMLLIGAVEAMGLGAGSFGADLGADADGAGLLDWLGIGRLPLLTLLVAFLAIFSLVGLIGQQLAAALTGAPLTPWLAVPAAAVASLPLTGFAARGLARVLPQDETSAIDLDELIGRAATVVTGRAEYGSPARARIEDRHGQVHYVMVEPDRPGPLFREGEAVLLVRQEGHLFRAITRGDALLPRLD
jgi:membrane protein implicated in regulation of membrane protease activity